MAFQLIPTPTHKQERNHSMGCQLKQLVPCLWSILFLLSAISFSTAKERPCKDLDLDEDQDPRKNYTMDDADFVFLFNNSELVLTHRSNLPDGYANYTRVLSTINSWIHLWQDRRDGLLAVDEASFSVTIIYQPLPNKNQITQAYSGLAFLIIPFETLQHLGQANDPLAEQVLASRDDVRLLQLSDPTSRIASVSSSYTVSVAIGMLGANTASAGTGHNGIIGVDIAIDPATVAGAASSYTVWIDYDRVRLSVYIDVEGKPKPTSAIAVAQLSISGIVSQYVSFGLVSTAAQLISTRGVDFNATVDELRPYYPDKGGFMSRKVTLLSSILGSVAATGVVAVAVAFYFSSRYRRWQRDLDQLAKSMERLPGVPTKIDFADINKATVNFHETMKLGRGGFGTVYRCTLPAAISKTEQPMDVAVKRFTRDVQNHRYNNFLAEVSIINRLRHKNIVPLVGWSYHKGEPLLVFEYMTNGSLEQHLFPKGGSIRGQRISGAPVLPWATRYEIVRDIVTGLHYVHHEYEPMVLHRDIKASNVMLDSSFHARLGDFGLACTVAVDRNSASGVAGTWGYIAPEYAMCGKATRQTDIYALGVLILEVVTGQQALVDRPVVMDIHDDEIHISDRVWRLYREGSLTECVDATLIVASSPEEDEQLEAGGEAERLLLLGLACSNPNPSDRPTMPDVVRIVAKSAPPPELPSHKPRFVWPPPEEGRRSMASFDDSTGTSMMSYLDKSTTSTTSTGESQAHVSIGPPAVQEHVFGRHTSFQHSVYVTAPAGALVNVSNETHIRV